MLSPRRLTASLFVLIAAASLPATFVAAQCSELADRWPAGPADAVFTRAGRAYFGSGTIFTIGDLSNPPSPVIETTALSGLATLTPSAVGNPKPSVP